MSTSNQNAEAVVAPLIKRARAAMVATAGASQSRVDEIVTAVAWSLYKRENAEALAAAAVRDTGLGNVADKVVKNQRKTFGALRDLLRAKTVGIIEQDAARGLVKYAKPVGVVAAITPSTNPAATPVNKTMMALKGGNAIIIAPSPAGWTSTNAAVELMRAALQRVDAPADLVQILPAPVSREASRILMRDADLVAATGSQNNVHAAYCSGTPALGVGAGNVPVIIDGSADLHDAAAKICASKTFDNATSCSSENSLIILDAVYDDAVAALQDAGGYLADAAAKEKIRAELWRDGKLNRELIAKDAEVFAARAGLLVSPLDKGGPGGISAAASPPLGKRGGERQSPPAPLYQGGGNGNPPGPLYQGGAAAKFFMVEEDAFDAASPFADEKLSLVLTLYRARDFDHAVTLVQRILQVCGRGHSCGIHTRDARQPARLAEAVDVVRVLVNQAHTFGNGGSFNNALNFTLSMGCGTWGGNSFSQNLNYRHFINITHLVREVEEDKPSEKELFGGYWEKYGTD